MTTYKKNSGLRKIALTFSLLGILAGCSNDSIETGNPAKTGPQLSPLQIEMLEVAAKGDNARVKELLDKGVDVNMRGNDRNTPIMEAAYAGHLDTVKLLLDHGADLSARKNDGATPTGLAGRSKDVLELFKNVSALVDAASKGNNQMLKELMDKGTPVNGLDQFGNSALTAACYGGQTDVVKLLLQKGANPNIKKSDGATPLSLATGQKHGEIVALLNEAIAKQPKGRATPPAAKGTPAAK
jgi:ankyrin repeat protein